MVDPDNTKITNYSLLFPLIQKKGNSLEPFPFQLICFISAEVCVHHLLPGLISQCYGGGQARLADVGQRKQARGPNHLILGCSLHKNQEEKDKR